MVALLCPNMVCLQVKENGLAPWKYASKMPMGEWTLYRAAGHYIGGDRKITWGTDTLQKGPTKIQGDRHYTVGIYTIQGGTQYNVIDTIQGGQTLYRGGRFGGHFIQGGHYNRGTLYFSQAGDPHWYYTLQKQSNGIWGTCCRKYPQILPISSPLLTNQRQSTPRDTSKHM